MNYYEILEVLPQATRAEIKAAYYRVSKELHPDKIPPDTPERARKLLEEKYKEITGAYSCLIDPAQRREYDQKFYPPENSNYSSTNNQQSNDYYQNDNSEDWFDENQIRLAAETLKTRIEKLELEAEQRYIKKIHGKEQELLRGIQQIKYKGEINNIQSIPDKEQSINQGIIISIIGFLVLLCIQQYLFGLIAIVVIFMGIFKIIYGIQMPLDYHEKILKIKRFHRELSEKCVKALQQKNEEIFKAKTEINERIQNFQSIPLSSITRDFISRLSSEEQVLLLVAIQKNKEQLNKEAQEMVAVALGIGAFAALLGLSFLLRVD